MSTSISRLLTPVAISVFSFATATAIFAQIPAGSSARSIPNAVEKSETQVTQIISRAEDHFRKGKLNLDDSKRDAARDEFDRAVDTILESGLDVRANQRLHTFYLELVERIYREEVPLGHGQQRVPNSALVAQTNQTPGAAQGTSRPQPPAPIGFKDQKFEPSPLDELSKLVLTDAERNVSQADV